MEVVIGALVMLVFIILVVLYNKNRGVSSFEAHDQGQYHLYRDWEGENDNNDDCGD